MGVRVACVPMWECSDLSLGWWRDVDLLLCPTRLAFDRFSEWKRRFGFAWDLVDLPWPIDTHRFRFRRRERCRRFLFVNGTGGGRGVSLNGKLTEYRRKGMETLLRAAGLLHPIPFLAYSQVDCPLPLPRNVELRLPPEANERLYEEGDVCVQPSHWEGLGLQMLECQAAGLPLVTTDAPPMNELRPLRAVRPRGRELVASVGAHVLTSHLFSPDDLAAELRSLYLTDISEASDAARAFIEREHSWETARPSILEALSR